MRVETGVREGDAISPWYDPMIAKLVAHGPDRASALAALRAMLAQTEVAGSTVNTAFLAALAADTDFAAGDVDTGLILAKQEALTAVPAPRPEIVAAAALAAAGIDEQPAADDPWSALAGYAHFHAVPKRLKLKLGEEEISTGIAAMEGGQYEVTLTGTPPSLAPGERNRAEPGGAAEPVLDIPFDDELPGRPSPVLLAVSPSGREKGRSLARWPGHVTVFDGATGYTFAVPDPLARADEAGAGADSLRAPMPGLVKVVRAARGDAVSRGQPLLVLEAMKMEHTIAAPHDGTIAEIAAEGAQVTDGTVLVRFAEEG
jgi:3-methylcrotonyl-CoA carboxylase alpha subunit